MPSFSNDKDLPDFTHFMESSAPSNSILHAFTCLEPIYDHWKQRKLAVNKNHLIPQLKTDDTIKNSQYDPYVCFRRREIKSGRKTRLTDQRSLEKLRRLRQDMETARTLLQMVVRREEMKKEDMIVDHKVFDKKCQVLEYQKLLGIQEDLSSLLPKKKVKLPSTGSTPSAIIKIPVGKLKADYPIQIPVEKSVEQLAIESELNKRKVIEEQYDTIDYEPLLPALQSQFYQALSNQNPIRYRKRIGRGGRLFIDRVGYRHVSSPSAFDKYRFDQSDEEEDDDPMEVDEMDDRYLRHRAQLLSDAKLGYFVTNHLSRPATQIPNTVEASAQRLSLATGAFGFKKQSKKRTPDEAALAMANDMIAANVAAAMKGGSPAARLDMNPQNNGMVH
ncbi:hypothetical protein RMCBS344292_03461 [Rhizopus microsporus]|nr:hypothetical protein RMCBS344292_03461 [Rhizopus microsporus]